MVQVTRFSVHQTSKVVAILYFCVTLLFIPLFIFTAFSGEGFMKWFFFAAPLIYGILGYVFTALACLAYNLLAKRIGGIEFTLSEPVGRTANGPGRDLGVTH